MSNESSGDAIWGLVVLALLGYGAWKGGTLVWNGVTEHSSAQSKFDPRDEQIKQLNARIAQLEAKPAEHHYELRHEGLRTFRFDPATGETCIQLTTKADWKKPETIRQGCEYADFLAGSSEPNKFTQAECWLVGDDKACQRLLKQ